MIGFDKPIRPEWIHAVGLAWRPHQPVGELIQVIDEVTAAEFRGPETRRKVATIILRCFVDTEGSSPDRKTSDGNVFAAAAHRFTVDELRAVYLAHLINATPVLQTITGQMARRYDLGDEIRSTDFLHRIYEEAHAFLVWLPRAPGSEPLSFRCTITDSGADLSTFGLFLVERRSG